MAGVKSNSETLLRQRLYESVISEDADSLEMLLKTNRQDLGKGDLLQRLLLFCCAAYFNGGVDTLLRNGADPNGTIEDDNQRHVPLSFFIDYSVYDCDPLTTNVGRFKNSFHSILCLFIKHGANLALNLYGTPLSWWNQTTLDPPPTQLTPHLAIHKMGLISAFYGKETTNLFLQSTPPEKFASGCGYGPSNDSIKCSAMTAVLYDIFQLFRHPNRNALNNHRLNQIIRNAFIPLLKSGCRLHPDPLSPSAPTIFKDPVHFYETVQRIKRIYPGISHIIVEGRRQGYQGDGVTWSPLTLQSICRSKILNNLPVFGMPQRNIAISSYKLPTCLENYLLYEDLTFTTTTSYSSC